MLVVVVVVVLRALMAPLVARWRSAGSLDVAYDTRSLTWCPRTIRCTVCAARCSATTGNRRERTIAARSAGLHVVRRVSLVSLVSMV